MNIFYSYVRLPEGIWEKYGKTATMTGYSTMALMRIWCVQNWLTRWITDNRWTMVFAWDLSEIKRVRYTTNNEKYHGDFNGLFVGVTMVSQHNNLGLTWSRPKLTIEKNSMTITIRNEKWYIGIGLYHIFQQHFRSWRIDLIISSLYPSPQCPNMSKLDCNSPRMDFNCPPSQNIEVCFSGKTWREAVDNFDLPDGMICRRLSHLPFSKCVLSGHVLMADSQGLDKLI